MIKLAIGIMSGTSIDGIDVALSEIKGVNESTELKFIKGITIPWPKNTANNIKAAMDLDKSNVALISRLNFEISHCYYYAINELLAKTKYSLEDIDFIAIHGQTIWHDPNGDIPSTLQIGDGSVLSELTNTTVVSNFRVADIIAGGQGAPLVPFFDEIMFGNKDGVIGVHNLGGISNLSLFVDGKLEIAFDTGPANMMIDYVMQLKYQKAYDEFGNIAQKGDIIRELYEEIIELNYFSEEAPKSTGRELFGNHYVDYLLDKYQGYNSEDYVKTFTMVTVDSIVDSYKKIINKYHQLNEIIFSGGGTHNNFILNEIKKGLPNTKISKSSDYQISVDYKEALAFIVLGNQTLNHKPSNLIKATGAKRPVVLGQISYR